MVEAKTVETKMVEKKSFSHNELDTLVEAWLRQNGCDKMVEKKSLTLSHSELDTLVQAGRHTMIETNRLRQKWSKQKWLRHHG